MTDLAEGNMQKQRVCGLSLWMTVFLMNTVIMRAEARVSSTRICSTWKTNLFCNSALSRQDRTKSMECPSDVPTMRTLLSHRKKWMSQAFPSLILMTNSSRIPRLMWVGLCLERSLAVLTSCTKMARSPWFRMFVRYTFIVAQGKTELCRRQSG